MADLELVRQLAEESDKKLKRELADLRRKHMQSKSEEQEALKATKIRELEAKEEELIKKEAKLRRELGEHCAKIKAKFIGNIRGHSGEVTRYTDVYYDGSNTYNKTNIRGPVLKAIKDNIRTSYVTDGDIVTAVKEMIKLAYDEDEALVKARKKYLKCKKERKKIRNLKWNARRMARHTTKGLSRAEYQKMRAIEAVLSHPGSRSRWKAEAVEREKINDREFIKETLFPAAKSKIEEAGVD